MSTLPDPPGLPDSSLVEAVKAGDVGAFETLVKRHQTMVFRFLYHFMGERGAAEEITQETFLNLYRKLHRIQPGLSLKSWLIASARNLAISHHRKRRETPVDPEILGDILRDVVAGPEDEVVLRERAKSVQAALAALPDEMREVLIMRYMLDFPLQKIAETLDIPEGTAKSRAFQGRAALRDALLREERREAAQSGS